MVNYYSPDEICYPFLLTNIICATPIMSPNAASSTKIRSLTVRFFIFRFALSRARLKRLPSVLVYSLIPIDEDPKALKRKYQKELEQVHSLALPHF